MTKYKDTRMRTNILYSLLIVCLLTSNIFGQTEPGERMIPLKVPPPPSVNLVDYKLSVVRDQNNKEQIEFNSPGLSGLAKLYINNAGEPEELLFKDGKARLQTDIDRKGKLMLMTTGTGSAKNHRIVHISERNNGGYRVKSIPMWLSVLPPLVAIILALLFKEVMVSLFMGIFAGAFIAGGLRIDSFYYLMLSVFEVVQKYVVGALADSSHMSIIVFSLLIGGMVAIISRNGGMAGVVHRLSKYARSPRSTQFITWLLGVAIFFDDYANTLIVGNTMRPVTDKFKISREKLAYIVDSTAAPVSAVAFITTWIGAELSYIDDATGALANFDTSVTSYSLFISSLKYSFYPILTLLFILVLVYTKKDFGPMLKAERRARSTGRVSASSKGVDDEPDMEDLTPVEGAPLKARNAIIPVFMVIFVTMFGLIDTGISNSYSELIDKGIAVSSETWSGVWSQIHLISGTENPSFLLKMGKLIGMADSYAALLWASFAGVVTAILLTVGGKIMNLFNTMHTMTTGFKTMMPAIIILTLAWALAITTQELYTADYITSILQDSISPYAMPVLIFVLAAFIAFSTGSSWSTMAILFPIAIPTTWAICQAQGVDPDLSMEILLNVIAVVLAASVVGDHCSPISDTTILSSLASDCNHIDHVRTQLPYALTVGTISLIAGGVSTLLGGGWMVSIILIIVSMAILIGIVQVFGRSADT